MEAVLRAEADPHPVGGMPRSAARASRPRRAAVLACGVGAAVVLMGTAVRQRVDAYTLTVRCDERERVEAITLQYQRYNARMRFEVDTARERRTWSTVMHPLPRAAAERLEYQAGRWRSFDRSDCEVSSEWKP